jgi:hypothetical protein
VSGEQRRRLAAVAAHASYPGTLLAAIAEATLPRYTAGDRLSDDQLGQVADAVELLVEVGLSAEQTSALLGACRERSPERWRERFWTVAIRAVRANARHAPPPRAEHSSPSERR